MRPACWRCRAHRPRVLYFPPFLPPLAPTARAAFRTMQLKVEVVSLWRRHPYPRHALLPCLSSIVAGPLGCRHPLLQTRLQPDNRSPSTLNLCTLGIERGNQPSPGFISIGRAKPSPAKHTVKDLALIDCHHRLPSLGSQLGVHENISDLWHQCQSKA